MIERFPPDPTRTTRPHLTDKMHLPAIIALARAGATALAWRSLQAARETIQGEPAALTLEGRLLKDLARQESGTRRAELFADAAAAYERAAALAPASYPLINAATLYHLSARPAEAARLASATLSLIDQHPDEAETPYYRAATRAEALLLLGRGSEAREALAEAVALAPDAIEDHASTIRQFALILDAQGQDAGWLDAHRPSRSLHFGGHMSFRGERSSHGSLQEELGRILARERIGFGYGALAAGADIIVAETLLEHGAQLHVVLPGGPEAFATVSVDPYGAEWRRRFDAVLAEAETIRTVRPLDTPPDDTLIALGDEVAIGAALANARRLESSAVQLMVVAEGSSQRARDIWAGGGWHQHIITAPRERDAWPAPAEPREARWVRMALLLVDAKGTGSLQKGLASVAAAMPTLQAPSIGPYIEGGCVLIGFNLPLDAAMSTKTILDRLPEARIGGFYGATEVVADPFSGKAIASGDPVDAVKGALASALPGTAYITDDFAAALVASGPGAPRTEFIGELESPDGGPPVGLYVLKS